MWFDAFNGSYLVYGFTVLFVYYSTLLLRSVPECFALLFAPRFLHPATCNSEQTESPLEVSTRIVASSISSLGMHAAPFERLMLEGTVPLQGELLQQALRPADRPRARRWAWRPRRRPSRGQAEDQEDESEGTGRVLNY